MKKLLSVVLFLASLAVNVFADSFTDAVQDLAVYSACLGTYSATQAGGGWYDDPHDFYTPKLIASRLAKESGAETKTTTFYGVCFNYAQTAFEYIKKYESWYNNQGMYERQYWLAGVLDNPNQIELMGIGTKNDYTRMQNGVPIKTYSTSMRNKRSHDNATYHAWIWIERADGVWFWVDPTWTDNLGYVVYGYVSNAGEIQCRPDKGYCINYPKELDNLPLPPAMGNRLSPSKTANSTDRNETIKDAATNWITNALKTTFIDVDYTLFNTRGGFLLSARVPFSSIIDDKCLSVNKMGFGIDSFLLPDFSAAWIVGAEYLHNLEDGNQIHGGVLKFDWTRRLSDWAAWYVGGGCGLRFDVSDGFSEPKAGGSAWYSYLPNTSYFAFQVGTGFLINISRLTVKIEASYDNILGFSLGTGIGWDTAQHW